MFYLFGFLFHLFSVMLTYFLYAFDVPCFEKCYERQEKKNFMVLCDESSFLVRV